MASRLAKLRRTGVSRMRYRSAMFAQVLDRAGAPLCGRELPIPEPGAGELLIQVSACGVCRTDLHIVDGELPNPKLPLIPGHEVVGRIAAIGRGAGAFAIGE